MMSLKLPSEYVFFHDKNIQNICNVENATLNWISLNVNIVDGNFNWINIFACKIPNIYNTLLTQPINMQRLHYEGRPVTGYPSLLHPIYMAQLVPTPNKKRWDIPQLYLEALPCGLTPCILKHMICSLINTVAN